MLRFSTITVVLFAILANGRAAYAETLRAADAITASRIDWMAFSRAQRTVCAGGNVQFIRHDHPAVSYAHIRRELWIAALYGILAQTNADACTGHLLSDELELARQRLKTPFALDIAIRDVPGVEDLNPRLIRGQMPALLIHENDLTSAPTVLRCKGTSIESETANIIFPTFQMAVNFSQSTLADSGFVFERDGRIAQDLFVRRFSDGTATVVNLTDLTRTNLTYCRGISRVTFDLHPADVVHLVSESAARLTRETDEILSCGLWRVTVSDGASPRLVSSASLTSAVKETYMGSIRYKANIIVPRGKEDVFLALDTNGAETEVFVEGRSLGIRAWNPYEWLMPADSHGKNVPVEIRIEKKTFTESLQGAPVWRRP